jgi:hypothetical protein
MTNGQICRNGGKNAVIYRKHCLPELRTKYDRRHANQVTSTRTTAFRHVSSRRRVNSIFFFIQTNLLRESSAEDEFLGVNRVSSFGNRPPYRGIFGAGNHEVLLARRFAAQGTNGWILLTYL